MVPLYQIIVALGLRPDRSLLKILRDMNVNVYTQLKKVFKDDLVKKTKNII